MSKSFPLRYWLYFVFAVSLGLTVNKYFADPPIKDGFELIVRISIVTLWFACFLTVVFLKEEHVKQNARKFREVRYINSSRQPLRRTITGHQEPLYDHEELMLYKRLSELLYGNYPTVQRLLDGTQMKFPGKSFKWVIEKTIDDLIRDRAR